MTNCIRCGRKLTDPQSIKRGYGPECWGKVQREEDRQAALIEPLTLDDPDEARIVYQEIWRRVLKAERQECNCGESISRGDLVLVDMHSGGYRLRGYTYPVWVYVECPKCGYGWSYWKLRGQPLDDLEKPPGL